MAKAASIQDLLKSGAHFGHLTRRWNPKMKDFIFMERNGIHIIDLKKTQNYLQEALDQVQQLSRAGKTILFVGTKKQSTEIITTEALRCGMPYITQRWMGGMLTNFSTVRKSISRMEEIEKMKTDGTFDELTKKEGLMLQREQDKLDAALGGIKNMGRLPGAIFVVDINKEHLAVKEAIKLHIPIIAMVDTNSDPDVPDFIVPCNDDSARTIQLITTQVADAIIEGAAEREAQQEEDTMEQAAAEAKGDSDDSVDIKDAIRGTKLRSRRKNKGKDKKAEEADAKADADSNDEEE
ncbi:30S ribosomal protein S2 [Gracilimonas sp.]|uniref:30S ribosomal protein S2 n=1 Tax=Gracilimonas sp. TaxID=1974203 RepID=UPI002872446D|nr:30S ribosomal protein S2 [Gracilimonas sp.]